MFDIVHKYYHCIFSRYFPRKLRGRAHRRLARAFKAPYPPPATPIPAVDALVNGGRPKVSVFIAHPDDETFCSGLLCDLKRRRGADIFIHSLTRGEGGITGGHPREEIGAIREDELRVAATILGVKSVNFLGYIDPLALKRRNRAPKTDSRELEEAIFAAIEKDRPQLVITHGSCGEYWHPAHVLLHDKVRKAVHRWNNTAFSETRLLTMNAWNPNHPLPHLMNEFDAPSLRLDASEFEDIRWKALAAHRTQSQVFEAFAGGSLREFIARTASERYHLVDGVGVDPRVFIPV